MATLNEIQIRIVAELRKYSRADRLDRTRLVKSLAESFVDAREHFLTPDGLPDWGARTGTYRRWVHECYSEANIDADDRVRIQQAVRFHAGRAVRDRLTEEEREDLGLLARTPAEAATFRRQTRSAMAESLQVHQDPGSSLRALLGARGLLSSVSAADVKGMSDAEREVAASAARALRRKADNLIRALG